jgi:sulfatase modifying factor 1
VTFVFDHVRFAALGLASTGVLTGLVACGGATGPDRGSCDAATGCASSDSGAGPMDAAPDVVGDDSGDAASESSSPVDAQSDRAEAGLGPGQCPSGAGPNMAVFSGPDASTLCIDETEVTVAQYVAFVATDAGTSAQPPSCSGNTSFAPTVGAMCPATIDDPSQRPDYPVSCVDWCDAFAYCAWAGKHLCPSISGGPINVTLPPSDTPVSYYACTNAGSTAYAYGSSYQLGACNDSSYAPMDAGAVPVGSDNACHGVAAGALARVFDVTGNVAEFQDNACSGGCLVLGSSYLDVQPSCVDGMTSPIQVPAEFASPFIGFRCCDVH